MISNGVFGIIIIISFQGSEVIDNPILSVDCNEINKYTLEHEWKQLIAIINYKSLVKEEEFLCKKALQNDREFKRRYKLRFNDSSIPDKVKESEVNCKIGWLNIEINKLKQNDALFTANFSRLRVIEGGKKQDVRVEYAKNNLNIFTNLKSLYQKYIERTNLELELANKRLDGISIIFRKHYVNTEDIEKSILEKQRLINQLESYEDTTMLLNKYIEIFKKTLSILEQGKF